MHGSEWFCGQWPAPTWATLNIAVLELYAVYVAVSIWASAVFNEVMIVHTDNMALVPVLNKLHSRDLALRRLLRPIAGLCLKNNIKILARHVAGVANVAPDLLSRGQVNKCLERFRCMSSSRTLIPEAILPQNCGLLGPEVK